MCSCYIWDAASSTFSHFIGQSIQLGWCWYANVTGMLLWMNGLILIYHQNIKRQPCWKGFNSFKEERFGYKRQNQAHSTSKYWGIDRGNLQDACPPFSGEHFEANAESEPSSSLVPWSTKCEYSSGGGVLDRCGEHWGVSANMYQIQYNRKFLRYEKFVNMDHGQLENEVLGWNISPLKHFYKKCMDPIGDIEITLTISPMHIPR